MVQLMLPMSARLKQSQTLLAPVPVKAIFMSSAFNALHKWSGPLVLMFNKLWFTNSVTNSFLSKFCKSLH